MALSMVTSDTMLLGVSGSIKTFVKAHIPTLRIRSVTHLTLDSVPRRQSDVPTPPAVGFALYFAQSLCPVRLAIR